MAGRKDQELARKERVAAMQREQQRRDRRQRIAVFGITGVIVAALAGGAAWAIVRQQADTIPAGALPNVRVDGRTSAPPWPLPANPAAAAEAAGLRVQPMEGTAKHFHAHLDVLVDGEPVTVPANLGIHPTRNAMSELHTHDAEGILHVEAPTADRRYTLGQVFAEWDVRLDADGIGGLEVKGDKTLRAYVDGKPVKGNPADIELLEHRQIALVYGDKGAKVDVPASYDFGDM